MISYTFKRDPKDAEAIEREKRQKEAELKALNRPIETFKMEALLIANLWDLMITILKIHPNCSEFLFKSNKLEIILKKGFLNSDNESLKSELSNGLLELMKDKHIFSEKLIQQIFPNLIKNVLPNEMSSRELRSDSFFIFLRNFFREVNLTKLQNQGLFSVTEFLSQLTKFIIEREPIEQQNKDFDIPLWGTLELIDVLLLKNPDKKLFYGQVMNPSKLL
jgi:hypothetical protein